MRPVTYRITRLLSGSAHPRDQPENAVHYSAELILEMLEVTISQGLSLPRALHVLASVLQSVQGEHLEGVAQQLESGVSWDSAWKEAVLCSDVLSILHDVLEPAYKRGASPILRIENAIEQLHDGENFALSAATHELSVRILMPLGLCFLPGFVALTVVPLLSAWFGYLG